MIHHQFKYSERINRLFYEDYVKYMELSDFNYFNVAPLRRIKVDEGLQNQLMRKYPGYQDFSTYNVQIFAQKD